MASNPPVPAGPVPFADVMARRGDPPAPEQPREDKDQVVLKPYKGFWLPEMFVPAAVALEQRFEPRPDDVIVASFPKCGTTWLMSLALATMMRRACPPAAADHPLRRLNPHQCVPFLDVLLGTPAEAVLDALPSPRLMYTHMPLAFLPIPRPRAGVGLAGNKVVYVCREPKDAVVSSWHFLRLLSPEMTFQDMLDSACDGTSPYGPFWDHFLGYWQAGVTWPDNMLFLRYEEMLRDPAGNLRKLASFVGQPFSPAEEEAGVVRDIVELCSMENLKSMGANNKGQVFNLPHQAFFRKGIAGDWKNHMTVEMARRMDEIIADKFHGTGLTFQ